MAYAINIILNYEIENRLKIKFRQKLEELRPNKYDFSPLSNYIKFNAMMSTHLDEEKNDWQVRLRLIKLKHIPGVNNMVYCIIQIGDRKFRTKTKSLNDLNFDQV
jgi:hypothetical protein